MTHFHHLRTSPWEPSFEWVTTIARAADRINVWHEDYPRRVLGTKVLIQWLNGVDLDLSEAFTKAAARAARSKDFVEWARRGIVGPQIIFNHTLRTLHSVLFNEMESHGAWRPVRVRVGPHYPPSPGEVPKLMEELEDHYLLKVRNVDSLVEWYTDFETIHPFLDGNGRVGGIVVAAYSHVFMPHRGWLAPNQ